MKRIAFVAAAVFAFALPLAAQLNDTYVIPAVGNAPGANNTNWATSLSLFNPHLDYDLKVSLLLIPSGGGNAMEALVSVPKNSTVVSDNVVGEVFRVSGTGALFA